MIRVSLYILLNIILTFGVFHTQAAIEVTDDIGQLIKLDKPAKRIVSLAPHVTENLFAAGVGHLIVGAVNYSDYPEQAKLIQIVGGYDNINVELIYSLNPDLIIAWKEGNQKQQVDKLSELGLTIYVDEPKEIEDVVSSIERYGKLTGEEKKATEASNAFISELNSLDRQYSSLKKVSVFYQVWRNPILTVNDKQIIGHAIKVCGGSNVFANLETLTPKVNVEAILASNPEAIIVSGMDESRSEWLDEWKQWTFLKAVKRDNLFFIHPDIIQRHTPRVLQGMRQMCEYLQQARDKLN